MNSLFASNTPQNWSSLFSDEQYLIQRAGPCPSHSLQVLLSRGADLDKRDAQGNTVLHYAAGYGRKEVAEQLLQAGADVVRQAPGFDVLLCVFLALKQDKFALHIHTLV